jgi:hypothetical protein
MIKKKLIANSRSVSPLFAADQDFKADMVLYNGKIITVDNNFSIVGAVGIKNGKFIAVGKKKEVMRLAGGKTQRIDLNGKVVIPGLIDSHNHMLAVGTSLKYVQLRTCKSMEDVLDAIRERAEYLRPGEWVVTSGQWHESQLKEKRLPTREEIDSVVPDNPVYVARGAHITVVNSMAFRLAGISRETSDPEGGEFKRDPKTGELTGLVLVFPAQDMIRKVMPKLTYEDKIEGLRSVVKEYNRCGITGVIEPGLGVFSDIECSYSEDLRAYMELWSKGELTVRTGIMVWATKPEHVKKCQFYQGFGNDILRISGIKMFMDGGLEAAWTKEPYQLVHGEQEKQDYLGVQVFPIQLFKETCLIAAENGWHVETHGVGDKAIETIVDTYEEVSREVAIKDLRWTVAHVFLPTQESINKMKQLGICATVQDHPTYLGANQLKYWGKNRATYAIPIRKLVDEGILLGGGSDAPVVHYDPFLSIWWMVTRRTITAGTLGPDQKIAREKAIELYTIGSAHFTFEEKIKGSIEPGKLADLVILDKDILCCPEDEIRNIKAVKTMVGGRFVFEA